MTRLIDTKGEHYRLVTAHSRADDEVPVDFLDERDAFAFLRRVAEDTFNRVGIRKFALENGLLPTSHPVDDLRVLKHLAANLISGRLRIVRPGVRQRPITLGSHRQEEGRDTESVVEETPPPEEKTWIKFEVVDDETGDPVKGVTLKIKLSDGQTRAGTSNAMGMIEINDIPAGACEIERMIDSDTLEVVAVE